MLVIWSGVLWLLIFFAVPETYVSIPSANLHQIRTVTNQTSLCTQAPVLLRRKAQQLRKETGDSRWYAPIEKMDRSVGKTVLWSCVRPFQLLFFEQMCLNLCLLSAILLGIIYLFFGVSIVSQLFTAVLTSDRPLQWCSRITTVSTSGKPGSPSVVS